MFTQFFGSYLLKNNFVNISQLCRVLEEQKYTRLKIGELAINSKYMTQDQVNELHNVQATRDVTFGDIAIEMGYLTREQVEYLLVFQRSAHLMLGQTMIEQGVLTSEQFENALNGYMRDNFITDMDFTFSQKEKVDRIIKKFYNLSEYVRADIYAEYMSLLFKNTIRFVGDDFTPLEPYITQEYSAKNTVYQCINGDFNAFVAIDGDSDAFDSMAKRFTSEKVVNLNINSLDAVGEFLNQNNVIFCLKMEDRHNEKSAIEPQEYSDSHTLTFNSEAFVAPIRFPFGVVSFIVSSSSPLIR